MPYRLKVPNPVVVAALALSLSKALIAQTDARDDLPQRPDLFVIRDTSAEFLNNSILPDMQATLVPVLRFMFPAVHPELAERFATGIALKTRPDLPELRVRVLWLSNAQADSIFQEGGPDGRGWERFRARYPGAVGVTEVSPVVFSSDFDQAMVYLGTQSDYVDGGGYVFLFEQRDSVWRLIALQSIWVS
jgi:hypothetical protein